MASTISSDEEANELFDDSDDLPGLLDCDSSDSEFWFSEVEDDDDSPHVASASESGATMVTTVAPLVTESVDELDVAAAAGPGLCNQNRIIELYDSGTTHHLSPYRDRFATFRVIPPKGFDAANQQSFSATGVGDLLVEVPNGMETSTIRLTEVLYSPEVGYTLVSIGRIDDTGCMTTFSSGVCTISSPSGKVLGQIPKTSRGLYKVEHNVNTGGAYAAAKRLTTLELHRCMGHISPDVARRLVKNGFVTGLMLTDLDDSSKVFCEPCTIAKAKRHPVSKERLGERATTYGGEIHSDLWGPAPLESLGGQRYYVSYTDDKMHETTLYLLRQKLETFKTYKRFKAWVRNHRDAKIKVLRTDRGGEYLSNEFAAHLEAQGTERVLTIHDTPQQNGVAECLNGILAEKVRALLYDSGLPGFLWEEAVNHATWLKNRTSTKALDGKTPFEAVHGEAPKATKGYNEVEGRKCTFIRTASSWLQVVKSEA